MLKTILAATVAVGLTAICTPSAALELIWSTGHSDLRLASTATECTLLVRTELGRSLPASWTLVYVAENGPAPLIVPEQAMLGTLVACIVAPPRSLADSLENTQVAEHCVAQPTPRRFDATRYVMRVAPSLHATFRVYEPHGALEVAGHATINGGALQPIPPLIANVTPVRGQDGLTVTVTGHALGSPNSILYRDLSGDVVRAFQITSSSENRLVAHSSNRGLMPAGVLEVRTLDGTVAAASMAAERPTPMADWAPGRLLIRFRGGEIEPPANRSGGVTDELTFKSNHLREELTSFGIYALSRLLPALTHLNAVTLSADSEAVKLIDLADLYVAHLDSSADLATVIERSKVVPEILYAHRDFRIRAMFDPNDQLYSQQWGLHYPGGTICGVPTFPAVHVSAPSAWNRTTGSTTTRIAILDTGIDAAHPDLLSRVDSGISFVGGTDPDAWFDDDDDVRHGTAVAGLIGANGDNIEGIAGLDWNARLVPVKVLNENDVGYISWLIQGIDWARQQGDIPIVNMSLGVLQSELLVYPDTVVALNDACYNAFMSGQLLLAASGNVLAPGEDAEDQVEPSFPAAYHQRVLAVGAILPDASRWRDRNLTEVACGSFQLPPCLASNWGDWLDLEAPGGRLIATTRGGPFGQYYSLGACTLDDLSTTGFGGTSASVPVVAGAAALLKGFRPLLTGEDIEQLLKLSALNITTPGYSEEHGWGFVRVGLAMNEIDTPRTIHHTVMGNVNPLTVVDSFPGSSVRFAGVPGLPSVNPIACTRYRLRGLSVIGTVPPTRHLTRTWVRAVGTQGWRDTTEYNSFYEVPFGRITFVNDDRIAAETFVYRIPGYGWFPVEPSGARVALTYITEPAVTTDVYDRQSTGTVTVRVLPNPIVRSTTFVLSIPKAGRVTAEVHDISGRRVAILANTWLAAGEHKIRWAGVGTEGVHCPAGVYFLRLSLGAQAITRRLVLMAGRP